MLRRIAKYLALTLLLAFLLWLAWPWWSPGVVRWLVADAGIELAEFHSGRPRLDGIRVENLRARLDTNSVEVDGAEVLWTLSGLRGGRLDSLAVDRVLVQQSEDADPAGAATTPLDSNVIPLLPVDRLVIGDLVLHAPHLPLRLQGEFRLEERMIVLRLDSTESPGAIPIHLTLRLDDDGRFLAQLHSNEDQAVHALEARGALTRGVLAIDGSLDLRDYELRLITGLAGITPMGGRLTGPIRATFDEDFNLREAEVLPVVSLQAESEQGRKRRFSLQGRVAWAGEDHGGGVVTLALADTSVSRTTAIDARVRLRPDEIGADGTVALSRSDFSSLMALLDLPEVEGAASGDFRLTAALPLVADAAEVAAKGRFDVRYDKTMDLAVASVEMAHAPQQPWTFTAGAIDFRQNDDGAITTFVAPGLTGEFRATPQAAFHLKTRGDASWTEDDLHLAARAIEISGAGQRTRTGWGMQFDLGWRSQKLALEMEADAAFDNLEFRAPVDWRVREPLLSKMLGMKTGYDVIAGHFTGSVQASMRGDATRTTVQGVFNQGRLTYGEHEARDVSATVGYERMPDGRYVASLDEVRIGTFDPGVPITEIRTSMHMDDKTANVGETSARLLGGTVRTAPFVVTFDPGDATFVVEVKAIDLGAVLALEGEDLDGTGILEGQLPIRMEAGAVTVHKGTVRSVGDGIIRVAPDLTRVISQPGLDFALRALEDFSYTSLEADVDYEANGDLLAAIRLKGRNPAIEKGRPIHYNLNISENIPSLLASLRVQDDVNERIERRVRAGTRTGAQPGTDQGASE